MDLSNLIPYPEPIPAPPEIFIILEQIFFLIHILLINSLLGLSIILTYRWSKEKEFFETNRPLSKKIPLFFALGINMAIPALLFIQVVYGNLFYTSSILIGTFWILIIPLLILAYYSSYFHYRKFGLSPYAKHALVFIILIVFYIAFILVNNLSMMEMPQRWNAYFFNREGTILLWNISSIYPRYLHFIVASIAIGGIVYSFNFRGKRDRENKIKEGLKIFAYATMIQIAVGLWFLLSLPKEVMIKYTGGDLLATIVLLLGIATAFLSIVVSLKGNLKGSLIFLSLTLISMIINRYHLRVFNLGENFSLSHLKVSPQWDVLALFLFILIAGIVIIVYMLKIAFQSKMR